LIRRFYWRRRFFNYFYCKTW